MYVENALNEDNYKGEASRSMDEHLSVTLHGPLTLHVL